MAWLQNLAGHAENLLNKIDQNAATVLSDGSKKKITDEEKGNDYCCEPQKLQLPTIIKPMNGSLKVSASPTPEVLPDTSMDKNIDIFTTISENQRPGSVIEENTSYISSVSSNSTQSSFAISQELEGLQYKVAKLELENQDVNKQLLNLQHLYSAVKNENAHLQFQTERLNEQLMLAQSEKEQYVARAQRILQEKEKLITLKQTTDENEEIDNNIFTTYNEELKKELEFQQSKVTELTQKNSKLINDLQSLQMQHQVIQQGLNQSNQSLEQSLLTEKRHRAMAEEDCGQKTKELHIKIQELLQLQDILKYRNEENTKLKDALYKKPEYAEKDEYDRIKSLSQTLMLKQNKLETVTTERNALRLQLEKLEIEHKKYVAELKRDRVKIINVQDTSDERIPVPNFMRVTPHDAGVTRRVKHAYSSLDAISVRTGIFLRRYPVARVFVFFYMVILHIWVLTVLLWGVPSN